MDPTKLPTDNLYKFLALAGLSLAGFCGWLIWRIARYTLLEQSALSEAVARLEAKSEINDLLLDLDLGPEATQRLLDKTADAKEALGVTQARGQLSLKAMKTLSVQSLVLAGGAVLGILVSAVGFRCWYMNVQRYTDTQTRADFEDHMAELAAKRIARAKAGATVSP